MGWRARVVWKGKRAPDEDDAENRETAGWGDGVGNFASVFPSVRRNIKPLAMHTLRVTMTLAEEGRGKWPPGESFLGAEPGSPAVSSTQSTRRTNWNPPAPELLGTGWGKAGPHWIYGPS